MNDSFPEVKTLTFDLFGTVLDLGGSLIPHIRRFLDDHATADGQFQDAARFWDLWRHRQRIEQYQDSLLMLGHSGYLETARRAFVYTLALTGVKASAADVERSMDAWQELSPFPEVDAALRRLSSRFNLVALSNGEPQFLDHLVKDRIRFDFDDVISVEIAGAFKPHPGVYRGTASALRAEPYELMMISANSFDVLGARACGYRGAFVNRYGLPYEDTHYLPDVTVADFTELADTLL